MSYIMQLYYIYNLLNRLVEEKNDNYALNEFLCQIYDDFAFKSFLENRRTFQFFNKEQMQTLFYLDSYFQSLDKSAITSLEEIKTPNLLKSIKELFEPFEI